MRIETLFWSAVVVVSCAVLVHRYLGRRTLNKCLLKAPDAYEAARAKFISGARAASHGDEAELGMLTAIETFTETRGGNAPPAFAELSRRERRFVELVHATVTLPDPEFEGMLRRLSKVEQQMFQQLRTLSPSREPLKSRIQIMRERLEARRRAERERKLAAEVNRETHERSPRFDSMPISDILEWLKTEAPRDPDMWHKLPELNWDYEEIYDILQWVVSQPECDASTAIVILHLMNVDVTMDLASGGERRRVSPDFDPSTNAEVKLLAIIGRRSEEDSFVRHELAPDRLSIDENNAGLLAMMQSEKQRIEAEGRNVPFPLPVKLLSKPVLKTGRLPHTVFQVNDDRLDWPEAMKTAG
ncbi:DUF4274 domain-containing protein [Pararhizobium sp. YC-54]|uniref:DUF4274 domain-containing protein n=1 Tax=Pararhizobium sp. YC-54 TaxID=2986920 RepID=UPI0021F7D2C7|nr:DUF4274 domain-containing protein [Pararhizobium sp. YC-54]MCV9996722.1 DUF4274 domain-containing protein [Pararhizobium sp. YC-54]